MQYIKSPGPLTRAKMFFLLLLISISSFGQSVLVNLAPVDGIDLTPDNIFNFQVQSLLTKSSTVQVTGTVKFRSADHRINFSFTTTLQPGINTFRSTDVHPTWEFSSSSLRELFMNYKVLPQGTYEYCVTVFTGPVTGDTKGNSTSDCLYRQAEDLFLINLMEPPNDAKLYEYYPMLSWVVNYPFANALTYRLRVAKMEKGQNPANALSRNNPVLEERNLVQPTIIYPVYAKKLEAFQPYAWTVDAYYKGILLGGAQPWKFTIIEDSLMKGIPKETSFVDITKEEGRSFLYAIGNVKLKYLLEDYYSDTLSLTLTNSNGKTIPLPSEKLKCIYGDNRFVIDLREKADLKHLAFYTLKIRTIKNKEYSLLIKYVNPDFF